MNMGQIKEDEHKALRIWAMGQRMPDPEGLVIRRENTIVF
jgi:hypothetical protein